METIELKKKGKISLMVQNLKKAFSKAIQALLTSLSREELVIDSETETVLRIYGELAKAGKLEYLTREEIEEGYIKLCKNVAEAEELVKERRKKYHSPK